jgi:glycosyltransferase involved in cell wall biosynthesis
MEIGFDAKRLYNNFTGLGNHSRTTIDILSEFYPDDHYVLYTPKIKHNAVTSAYIGKRNCLTRVPEGWLRGSGWRTFGVSRDVKRDGIDVFHGLSNELPAGLRVPSVVTIHDVAFKTFPDMYHWPDRKLYDMKWKHALGSADRIIAISESTKRDILKYYDADPDKIDVVYQPVARRYYEKAEKRHLEAPFSVPFMLYVGSINSRKNLLGAVKAMEMLPSDLQIPLVVIGSGREYRREVETYVASHNLKSLVIFPDRYVDDAELQQLYMHAELFVYPSFCEGFGLPVVEALLCGCPVVTSCVSSLPEAAGEKSLKADPSDVSDISHKMQMALTDSILRSEMKTFGRDYAMRMFHPKRSADKLMEIYNGLKR